MSRVANSPITLPAGVELRVADDVITVKSNKGTLTAHLFDGVEIKIDGETVNVMARDPEHVQYAGTTRSLVNNMVIGLGEGFQKALKLVGVGFRAAAQGNKLNLSLGFSHPVEFPVPEGISIETPSATDIIIKGADKQLVGQVAANIRAFRPPEPYKGKGVRYADEQVSLKEAKKA